ncbi:MAG: adenylate/guanylate cyclase domain-containing protein [Ferruginibacter sp.]
MKKLLHENAAFRVFYLLDEDSGKQNILKISKNEFAGADTVIQLNHELEITQALTLPFVRKAIRREKIDNCEALVLEYFDGESILDVFVKRRQTLLQFMMAAIKISGVTGELHQHNIIHKDLNSDNILINKNTGEIKIISFGISSRIDLKTSFLGNPEKLEGNLSFISPEQTGRMNRLVDYRSDLYSLGITFYEMLTGKLPFISADPVEIIHNHIAKVPPSPSEKNPAIPDELSNIVMKLMNKNAEDRYHSAFGLQYDLEQCLIQLKQTDTIQAFPLGERDFSGKFTIEQKLYGRSRQLQELLEAFHRTNAGAREVFMVKGSPGAGKTALVHEVHRLITEKRGYFVEGKFDQFKRNVPYFAITKAFDEFCSLLLTEREESLNLWRERILVAASNIGALITAIIPKLELIIGKQPEAAELGVTESQNRFFYIFRNFVRVIATKDHPFIFFIDDLQWADSGSLHLLQNLITDHENKYFLFVGAYRDNEISTDHPLQVFFNEIQKTHTAVSTVSVNNLSIEHITELLQDSLNEKAEAVQPFAQLIAQKTEGNAFFVTQFLKSLYLEKMLTFDYVISRWHWELSNIRKLQITDNVVDLMTMRVKKLPERTQTVLKLAACIGNRYDIETLAIINKSAPAATANDLWAAIEEGLVSPADNAYKLVSATEGSGLNAVYLFAHDRIQQAAYSLISDSEGRAVHFEIGKLLLNSIPAEKRDERIFEIVYQINLGLNESLDPREKNLFATLNLQAGKKAKQSSAFKPALSYLNTGINLLNEKSWSSNYDLILSLYIEGAEAAYLSGDYILLNERIYDILQHATSALDRVKAYSIKIDALTSQNNLAEALKTGVEALEWLGVRFPKNPKMVHIFMGVFAVKIKMMGRKFEMLHELPEMKDELKLRALPLMERLTPSAYMSGSNLFPLIIFEMVKLSVKYGNSLPSAFGYASYAITLSGVLGDIESGTRLGNASMQVLDRHFSEKFKVQVLFVNNVFIRHWTEHLSKLTDPLIESYHLGLKVGNLVGGIWAAYYALLLNFLACENLKILNEKAQSFAETFLMLKQDAAYQRTQMLRQTIVNMMNGIKNPTQLDGEFYREEQLEAIKEKGSDKTSVFTFYLFKLMLACHYHKFDQALDFSPRALQYAESAIGLAEGTWLIFYDTVAILGCINQMKKSIDKITEKRLYANMKKLKKWAKNESPNYAHKYYFARAEFERWKQHQNEARYWYDRALQALDSNGFAGEEALLAQTAAGFCGESGLGLLSDFYLKRSFAACDRWGSDSLKEILQRQYPLLIFESPSQASTVPGSSLSIAQLDVFSVIKASTAISGEIKLNRLLEKLMIVAIENAGAQRGCLFLFQNEKLILEAEAFVSKNKTELSFPGIALSEANISQAVIQFVWRSLESQAIKDASNDYRFSNDDYILKTKTKSILCMPIINQGQLKGILYLENNLTAGAFSSEQTEILKVLSGQMAISLENAMLYESLEKKVIERTRELAEQKKKSDDLLLNILPAETAEELKTSGAARSRQYENVTVMFTDFVNFTKASELLSADSLIDEINFYYSAFDEIVTRHGIEKIKTIGDSYMCAGGLPVESKTHAFDTVMAALDMKQFLLTANEERRMQGKPVFNCRIGIHSGPVVTGIVGTKKFAYDIWGDTVNIASRMESSGEPGKVNISGSTYALIHDQFRCTYRGEVSAKNKGSIDMYFIEEAQQPHHEYE